MAFKKGEPRPEGAGRKKGSENKTTAERKERLEKVLGFLDETLEKDLKLMSPRERAHIWVDLQEHILPKLARVTTKDETPNANRTIIIDLSGNYAKGTQPDGKAT